MKTASAKAFVATLSALLILPLFFFLVCDSSSSSPHAASSVLRSRRLLSTQCHDATSCATPLRGLDKVYNAPKVMFESLKKMPKSRSNPSHN
ncbi:hypothetical protein ACP4OV_027733 [Aristida adscensionis]